MALSGSIETVIGITAILSYARVSTTGQDLDAQLAALTAAGVEAGRVFTDKLSGSVGTKRSGLNAMLDYARGGDTVIVTAIDRLGRSVAEVTRTIADLSERRIVLRVFREGIDTATLTGRAVAAVMAALAELELELGRERRAASRESRRPHQLPATKPPKLGPERQEQLRRLAPPVNPCQNWPQLSVNGSSLESIASSQAECSSSSALASCGTEPPRETYCPALHVRP